MTCLALVGLALASPATAVQPSTEMTLGGERLSVTGQEMRALSALGSSITAQPAAQKRALEIARRVAQSDDARYMLARYELEIGGRLKDDAMRAGALDALLARPDLPRAQLVNYLGERGALAMRAHDLATADRAWSRLLELQPGDAQTLYNVALLRRAQGDAAAGLALIQRAIDAQRAAGGTVPENWLSLRLAMASNAKQADAVAAAAQDLVAEFPTQANWRMAMVAYRQTAILPPDAEIDLFRLMRERGLLSRQEEYLRMAQLLQNAGAPSEGRAVIGEGIAGNFVDPAAAPAPDVAAALDRAIARRRPSGTGTPIATELRDTGRLAEAAAAYRADLARTAGDPALTWRLATVLRMAGQPHEGIAMAKSLADSSAADPRSRAYAQIARFWLAANPS